MINKLKKKWGIQNNFQFWLIFGIFGLSGTSTLFVKIPLYAMLGITESTDLWIKIVIYITAITPAYFVLLLIYGSIFGQFRFFWAFTKKFFGRFAFLKKIF